MRVVLPFVLLAMLVPAAFAQTTTTYSLSTEYDCIGAESHYPHVPGVFCEGMVPYGVVNGVPQVKVQFNLWGRFEMSKPFQIDLYCYLPDGTVFNTKEKTTEYTDAKFDGTPGTFTFTWEGYDVVANPDPLHNPSCVNYHHGSASGTWIIDDEHSWNGWFWATLEPTTGTNGFTIVNDSATTASLYLCGSDRHACLK